MITSIKIKNFKGYKNTVVPLSRVTLIGGRNNVGKTNFLEALFMMHDRYNPQLLLRNFALRGIHELSMEPDSLCSPIFYKHDMDLQIEFSIVNNGKKEIMKLTYNPKFKNSIPVQPTISGMTPQIRTDQMGSSALDIHYKIENEKEQEYLSYLNMVKRVC